MSNNKNKSSSKIWQLELANKNMELEISARKQIERSLKNKEDRFRTIFSHAPVTYFLCNLSGDFLDGNLAAHQLTGYTNEELFGKNFINLNLIDKKDQKAILEIIARCGRGENTGPDELSLTKKDGSKILIEISTRPVTILEQRQILGIAQDITDRKLAQLQLQESEERFRKLFDSAHDALMTLNPPTWKFTSGNPAILNMFKVKNIEEFLTYGPWNISPEKQPDGRLSSEKAKEMIGIAMEKGSNFFNWTHKRLNGESFPATVLLTRIQLNNEIFLQATIRDITKPKRAEDVNKVLFDISNAVNTTQNLSDLYRSIHKSLENIIDVTNFFIAIVDIKKHTIHFPYHVDTTDDNISSITNFDIGNSLTGLVVSQRKPILLKQKELEERANKNGVWGPTPLIWMGVPLIIKDEVIGVIATQSYINSNLYSIQDLQILSAVSDQVSIAIDRKRSEDAVRESEKKYRDLFEKSKDPVLIIHNEKFVDCNQATINMLRYKNKNEFLNTHPSELSPKLQPDGRLSSDKAEEMMKTALINGSHRFEWDHKRSDGEVFPVEVLLTAISTDEKNRIIHTVWRDITERKQAEKALKENEEKYHSLTENLPLGIYRNTPGSKGKFLEVNKALIDMFGYKDRETMMAAPVSSLYASPQTRKKFSDKFAKQGFVKNEELRLRRKNGSTFIASSTAIAIKDDSGKVIHYDGIIEDISEQVKLRTKMQENEEKFRSIVSNSPSIIMQTDRQGVISFINYKYSGEEPEDVIGKTIYDFMPREFHEIARNTIQKVFKKGESYTFENLGFSPAESVVWYKNTVSSIQKNGKVVGVVILAADISEQKQTDIMKTEFISSVSHELRTPLTIIRESLSILSDELFGKLNKDQADIVNPCIEDVDRLGRIINNLLDISRMEGQKIKIEREMVDIVKLAHGVVSSFSNKADSKNIKLVFTPNRESINLYIDNDRIIQVFMNLIGNAIKFTEEGKIEIIITEKKAIVECCILDTGRGIEQNDLGTLFDRFHQVGKVMRAGEKGSGLGLSISKGIIKLHKGKIWVDSEINKGSKFCFALPKYSIDDIVIENIDNKISKVADKHIKFSLLALRLNNFSDIESKFSVNKSNTTMKMILQIIQDELAPGEFSFIKGKDEVILFSDITKQNIIVLFSKLEDMLAKSVLKIDKNLTIDLSYGYSLYPDDGDNADVLIKNAFKALINTKKIK